jgi:hypothetical protein
MRIRAGLGRGLGLLPDPGGSFRITGPGARDGVVAGQVDLSEKDHTLPVGDEKWCFGPLVELATRVLPAGAPVPVGVSAARVPRP